jgi:hypothetical protein
VFFIVVAMVQTFKARDAGFGGLEESSHRDCEIQILDAEERAKHSWELYRF